MPELITKANVIEVVGNRHHLNLRYIICGLVTLHLSLSPYMPNDSLISKSKYFAVKNYIKSPL